MSKQIALWASGAETVRVVRQAAALVIEHRVTRESRARSLTLPYSRGLLLALREACDQALKAEVPS
jgi:hypothetical protein